MNTNNKFVLWFLVVALIFVGAIAAIKFYSSCSGTGEVARLMSFVGNAKDLISQKGEGAFVDFRDANGDWINGENYIFIYDMDGNTVVLPPQSELEGTNRLATQDPEGKFFVREMTDILKLSDSGWLDYKYMKPGKTESSAKLSYFKKVKVGEKEYFVGSGIYLD